MPGMSDDATMTASTSAAEPAAASETPAAFDTNTPVEPRCPWCSELLPPDATVRCPHCHANLTPAGDPHLPGLTEVEAPGLVKARRTEPVKRSKLLSWISGEVDDTEISPLSKPSAPEALEPPARDVRREMLRLQLEAEGLTVTPDGTIEVPPVADDATAGDAASSDAPAPVVDVDADADASDHEIRKAS